LLALEPNLDVVAQASDGSAAVDATLAHRADVAVVDLEMPVLDGLEVTTELLGVVQARMAPYLHGSARSG
jgi:two-component system response regulator DesR